MLFSMFHPDQLYNMCALESRYFSQTLPSLP
jgi:hypothetical protein